MKLQQQLGLGILLNVAGTITNALHGMVNLETVLSSICSGGNVDIWLISSGNGVGFDITMDLGPW